MFMVQKRLRNGQRYGFVRFKFVVDAEELLKRLRKIKVGDEYLRVFIAYDRRSTCNRNLDRREMNGSRGNTLHKAMRRCRDIWRKGMVLGGPKKIGRIEFRVWRKKVKEEGIQKVEVKFLGGLEVMVVFDSTETAGNILSNDDHDIRRWLHKLRKWRKYYKPSGIFTWVNIIGVLVSCWSETFFKKIATLHESIVGTKNCNLNGNPKLISGRVQIHTCVKGLINEALSIKFRGMIFEVNVVEDIRDICEVEIEEASIVNYDNQSKIGSDQKKDEDDMVISEDADSDRSCDDSNREEEDNDDEEEDDNRKEEGDRRSRLVEVADRNNGVDEGSVSPYYYYVFIMYWAQARF
ncbi:transposon TX1 [Tanacetum coccineum]|uniref:Transposon TX1 n=1 Tax=Tanacetum coccineum TaxID=301880 RepID=A0ABQ5B2Z5_9ASTR